MRIFYGWRIVAAACLIQFLLAGLLTQALGAYVAVLAEDMGWSKTALAAGAALQSLEGAIIGPLLGWAMDRLGAKRIVQAGLVIFGLGFFVLSQVQTIAGFYTALLLLAVGTSLGGYFPLTITVVHWFRRWRARALAFISMGLAFGGIAVPAVAWCMQHFGWRTTAIASGLLAMAVGLPLTRVLVKQPSDIGETEDGLPPPRAEVSAQGKVADGRADAAPEVERSFTAQEALRTPAFWLLALGHGFALLVVTSVNVHAITHMKEGLGYSVAQASFVISLMTMAQAAGVLLGAAVGDRWDKRLIAAACMLAHMVGLLMLTFAVHPVMLGAFAVLHGVAWGLRGPLMQAMRADYFGLRSIGMILGLSAFIISLGQIAGPLLAGAFADAMGHYRWGFTVLALAAGSGSVLFLLAKKPK